MLMLWRKHGTRFALATRQWRPGDLVEWRPTPRRSRGLGTRSLRRRGADGEVGEALERVGLVGGFAGGRGAFLFEDLVAA